MREELGAWAATADLELMAEHHSFRHYASVGLFCAAVVFGVNATSGARAYIQLDPHRWAVRALPPLAALLVLTARRRARASVPELLLAGPLVTLVAASFLASSGPNVAQMFGAFVILTIVVHGYLERATPRRPFVVVADATVALAVAFSLSSSPQRTVLLIMTMAGAVAGVLVGMGASHATRVRQERLAMREAILAAERAAQVLAAQGHVVASRANAHDVRDQLTVALAGAAMAREALAQEPPAHGELRELLDATFEALERAATLSNEGRLGTLAALAPVCVAEVVAPILRSMRLRFPSVRFEWLGSDHEAVWIDRGATTLERIVQNLVVNACEGDGRSGCTHVRLALSIDPVDACLTVEDDGPGFDPSQLGGPAAEFSSTKTGGTGLGLYTVERLVGASGGRVHRENRPGGGARVAVWLRPVVEASS